MSLSSFPVEEPSLRPPMAVVILNWNGAQLLQRFLPSVLAHTPSSLADVVVVDNGSTDGSLALLSDQFPSVKQLVFDCNLGYAGGYNRAVKELDYPYLCLLNSDIELKETSKNWLERPIALFNADPLLAALQPKILSQKNPSFFEYAGAAGGYVDCLGYPFCRGRIFDTVEQDRGQYDSEQAIFWASGACLFVRREAFLSVGGFDELFFAHMEEIDFCWRLHRAGFKVAFTPRSVVYHVGGASLSESNPRKTFLNFRNNRLMLRKNLPSSQYHWVRLIRFVLDLVSAFVFLLSGRPTHARAVVEALLDQQRPSTPPPTLFARKSRAPLTSFSILWQYHILGRKFFFLLPKDDTAQRFGK